MNLTNFSLKHHFSLTDPVGSAKPLFGAQAYIDEATTPIEDAKSVWPTPFETIATLTLPAQRSASPAVSNLSPSTNQLNRVGVQAGCYAAVPHYANTKILSVSLLSN